MQTTNSGENNCKRELNDSAKATIYMLKYEDALAENKFMEAKIERLQSKIDYLNRCLTDVAPDDFRGEQWYAKVAGDLSVRRMKFIFTTSTAPPCARRKKDVYSQQQLTKETMAKNEKTERLEGWLTTQQKDNLRALATKDGSSMIAYIVRKLKLNAGPAK